MRSPRVLIIDDNEGARTTVGALLRLEGITTFTADSGHCGIQLSVGERPDMALVDLHLPDISGIEVIRAFKARGLAFPAVIVTVFPDLDTCVDATACGAAGYVEGLLDADELADVVWRALRGQTGIRHPATTAGLAAASSVPPPIRCLPTDHRVRQAVRIIDREADEPCSPRSLADAVEISESRLRHLFVETIGVPLSRFVRDRRLHRAARQLLTTKESFRVIAGRLHLSRELRDVRRAFVARFGMTPRAYRKRVSGFWSSHSQ